MKKYYAVFAILTLVILGVAGYIVSIGVNGRQDLRTQSRAEDIAEDLNSYVSKNKEVPASLEAAGISDVPSTITYTKKSTSEYEFCMDFKQEKGYGDFGGADISTAVTGAALSRAVPDYEEYTSTYRPSSLYISYTHKAGKTCQTVQPYGLDDCSDTYSTYSPTCLPLRYEGQSSPLYDAPSTSTN